MSSSLSLIRHHKTMDEIKAQVWREIHSGNAGLDIEVRRMKDMISDPIYFIQDWVFYECNGKVFKIRNGKRNGND